MAEKIIVHSGILGQKWGLRRYQNSDGTYTEEGKQRRRKGSDDYIRSRELQKKGYKNLSNKELDEYNNRIEKERKFKQANRTIGQDFVDRYKGALLGTLTGIAAAATVAKGKDIVKWLKKTWDEA